MDHTAIDEKVPNLTQYEESGIVKSTKRLQLILDIMIDIVDKIEKL